ncbi:hypothetical protein MKW92_021672 [Papaver armeniacum]|nr:hypothetical protein MKW92_021672 [Papaver armeniacum]
MNEKVEDPLSGYVLVSAPHGTYCGQWQLSLSFISTVNKGVKRNDYIRGKKDCEL